MARVLFTSDLHLGHYNCMVKYDKRPFKTIEEMDLEIIKRWNKKVSKEDTVYVLGDISWYKDEHTAEILKQLNGTIILIKGNHDHIGPLSRKYISKIYDYLEIKVDGKDVVLCHYPIHFYNKHHRGAIMLYGHVHNTKEYEYVLNICEMLEQNGETINMFNVGCMLWDYEPVTLDEILNL